MFVDFYSVLLCFECLRESSYCDLLPTSGSGVVIEVTHVSVTKQSRHLCIS